MIENLEKYAEHLNANQEVLSWLRTTGKKALLRGFHSLSEPTESQMEHVLDFLVSSAAPSRLQKMSFVDAKRLAKEWSERNQKKGKHLVDTEDDIETIHSFKDGTKIVKLKTKKAFEREGFLMSHCVGGYNPNTKDLFVYSYRDGDNMPHATFEVRKNGGEIVQIKGKGNGSIHPKYIHPILEFLKVVGVDIRPNDMVNLGYHHIHKDHLDFLRKLEGADEQIVMISGEAYAI
jgi:hypothetical protein